MIALIIFLKDWFSCQQIISCHKNDSLSSPKRFLWCQANIPVFLYWARLLTNFRLPNCLSYWFACLFWKLAKKEKKTKQKKSNGSEQVASHCILFLHGLWIFVIVKKWSSIKTEQHCPDSLPSRQIFYLCCPDVSLPWCSHPHVSLRISPSQIFWAALGEKKKNNTQNNIVFGLWFAYFTSSTNPLSPE